MIKRRHVFHIAGFDPASADAQHARFVRQLRVFKQTWNVSAQASELAVELGRAKWSVTTQCASWETHCTFEALTWDDLIAGYARRSRVERLFRAAQVYADLCGSGTLFRYFWASWRYFLFAVVPAFEVLLFGALSIALGMLASRIGTGAVGWLVGISVSVLIFGAMMEWAGRRWRLFQAFDDWIMAVDYVHGRDLELTARIAQFAQRIAASLQDNDFDEIIVVGHSLGAMLAADAVAQALKSSEASEPHPPLSLVTVGATIPKCALHPAADRLRQQIAALVVDPSLFWAEFQVRADNISFYRFNPATLRHIASAVEGFASKPLIRLVPSKAMLLPATYKKFKYRVMRLHYQVVSANDRKAFYDYFMMSVGPAPIRLWAASPNGLLDFVEDGSSKDRVA